MRSVIFIENNGCCWSFRVTVVLAARVEIFGTVGMMYRYVQIAMDIKRRIPVTEMK
jgi:hypothetical protein